MEKITAKVKRLLTEETGISSVEYVLLVGLIGLVVVGGITLLDSNSNTQFQGGVGAVGS